jgi:hypothetical protein
MGAYLETRLIGAASISIGIELEIVNQGGPPPTTNPFLIGANGSATGIMLAAGGDPTQTTSTVYGNAAAIAVTGGQNNNAGWQVGLLLGTGSITIGGDGLYRAMDMPTLHDIRWTDSASNVGGSIMSAVTAGNQGQRIQFTNAALLFRAVNSGLTLLSLGQTGVVDVPGMLNTLGGTTYDAPTATYHTNAFSSGGSIRWAWGMDNVAESGGAAGYGGGNLFFQSYNNSGAAPVAALQLQRNGQVNIGFCAIAGGSINGTVVGLGTPASAKFTTVGFNSAAPIAKPTVTGSKGANAALASLLTALASYGLVTDSST